MKKSTLKRVLSVVATVVIVAQFALIAILLYGKITGKQVFRISVLWVLSPSMEDTIPARSYILVRNHVDPAEIEENDIITFHSRDPSLNGALNTHRVVEVIGDHEAFRTKGDHNLNADTTYAYAEDVVAVYERNLPFLSFFGRLFSTPAGLTLILIVILILSFTWFSISGKKAPATDEKQEEIERRIAEEVERLRNNAADSERQENDASGAERKGK